MTLFLYTILTKIAVQCFWRNITSEVCLTPKVTFCHISFLRFSNNFSLQGPMSTLSLNYFKPQIFYSWLYICFCNGLLITKAFSNCFSQNHQYCANDEVNCAKTTSWAIRLTFYFSGIRVLMKIIQIAPFQRMFILSDNLKKKMMPSHLIC